MYPKIIKRLIEDFKKLPGIGEKSAERLAIHVATKMNEEDILNFGKDLTSLKESIQYCKICHNLSENETCEICSDTSRNKRVLMVVADIKDVFVMEKTNTFKGVYHVLGGVIDFSRGVGEEDLHIDDLIERLNDIDEVILATDGTVEGEITAKFLRNIFEGKVSNVTRLAYGLPVGMDLKYADDLTLIQAINNRKKY